MKSIRGALWLAALLLADAALADDPLIVQFEQRIGPIRWSEPSDWKQLRAEADALAAKLLDEGDRDGALRVVSRMLTASESPIDRLYAYAKSLPEERRKALWPKTPFLVIEDFSGPHVGALALETNEQERAQISSEAKTTADGADVAALAYGDSHAEGPTQALFSNPGFELSWRPFAIRARARTEHGTPLALVLRSWEETRKRTLELRYREPAGGEDGWQIFDTGVSGFDLLVQLAMAAPTALDPRAHLYKIGFELDEGGADTLLVDEIIAYLPEDWQDAEDFDTDATRPEADANDEESFAEAMEALEAIGYLGSTSVSAEGATGVTIHDESRAYAGYTAYASGHRASVIIIDMDGEVVHEWQGDYSQLWDDMDQTMDLARQGTWRKFALLDDGQLLAIHEGRAIVKVDRDSSVIWAKRGGYHHDLQVMPDGSIWVLYREPKLVPRINPRRPILEEFAARLSPDGEMLEKVSLLEAVENSHHAPVFARSSWEGDLFHSNTIEILDGRLADEIPAFRAGNILTSFRHLDLIGIVDPEAGKMVWSMSNLWVAQHHPTVTDAETLMVFDNEGLSRGRRGNPEVSRVLEINPATQEVLWHYTGTPNAPFFSKTSSTAERLPNGNTLIVETDRGRVFEVTPEKEIVWEFRNPETAGEEDDVLAAIFDALRLDSDDPIDWLEDDDR